MSNLVEHAEREMRRAGLFDKDSDYDGMLGPAVLKMVEAFAGEGHSGYSASRALAIFNEVARFRTLTPLTSDPEEWFHHDHQVAGYDCWQNVRDSAAFSRDGGKTWYHLDDPEKCNGDVHTRPASP